MTCSEISIENLESVKHCSILVQDFEIAKVRQDRQLDGIERGLGTLKEIGEAMGQALNHQDVLTDAIVEKVCLCNLV